jgi:uncharacterized RDD family membrane protein YckC
VPSGLPGGTGQLVLASWWSRVGAAIIDGLIIGAAAMVILIPLGVGVFASGSSDSEGGVIAFVIGLILAVIALAVVALIYAPVMMWKTNGKTVGRMVTGIRVVRANGQPMDFGTAALREVVVKALGVGIAASLTGGIAYLVDVLWPLWDDENRALHDFPTNTRTVKG